jgi:hypothetical protein
MRCTVKVVRRLLMKGINREVIDSDDMTAAMLATVCQQEHCVQLINECKPELLLFVASVFWADVKHLTYLL